MRTLLVVGVLLAVVCGVQPVRADEEAPLELPLPLALRDLAGRDYAHVERVFGWLGAHQSPDGHWDAADWDLHVKGLPVERSRRLPGRGTARENVIATSMALCALLGAGYTHRGRHPLAEVVRRGCNWLTERQEPTGRIGPDVRAHAWATLALTELYGMTSTRLWREQTKRALLHLMEIQDERGGWLRDDESGKSDLLGTFFAVLPLKSLQWMHQDRTGRGEPPPLGLDPAPSLARMRPWLADRTDSRTGSIKTDDARPGEHTLLLTAAGMLTRIFLGADPRTDRVVQAAAKQLAWRPPTPDHPDGTSDLAYAWFGTLAMFQVGGEHWKTWNDHLKSATVDTQRKDGSYGHLKGSWDVRGLWVRSIGRIASTALAAMCLEVYYRYDKVFGDADGPGGVAIAPVAPGTWRRSALPSHAAQFEDRDGTELPIESARLAAEVHGVRARVVMDLWVRNPSAEQHEGRLRLRLPDGAAPYYLAFGASTWKRPAEFEPPAAVRTDLKGLRSRQKGDWGSMREARMARTQPARRGYETIVSERRDPALLTWAGGGVFELGVFPLAPKKLHRVVLAYEVDLTPVGDEYQLDLHLPEEVPHVAAAVTVRGPPWRAVPDAPAEGSLRRWMDPEDRALRVFVRPEGDVVLVDELRGGDQHVAMWIRPPLEAEAAETSPRAVFLLDTSASGRSAHYAVRLELLEALLENNRDVLKELRVAFFDSDVRWWRDGFVENTADNVAALLEQARGFELAGATDLDRALQALWTVKETCDVFLLSDGDPTWGVTDFRDLTVLHEKRVFAYRTGLDGESNAHPDWIAGTTGGALISVLGPADVGHASTAHRQGVWWIGAVYVDGVHELMAWGRPRTLHAGQQLRLVGRGRLEPGTEVELHLHRGRERRTVRIPLPAAIPSDMAARAFGHAAVVELEALGEGRRDLAQAFASRYRVVRESTSLLMMESEKDYARFGIRKRADLATAWGPLHDVLIPIGYAHRPEEARPSLSLDGLFGFVAVKAPGDFEVPDALRHVLRTRRVGRYALSGARAETATRPPSRRVGTRLEEEPDRLDALLAVAYDAWDAGLRRQAYVGLCASLARQPRSRLLQWQLARMAQALGLHDEALVWFELALAWRGMGHQVKMIAHDYARFLRHVLSERIEVGLIEFARARATSLEALDLVEEADLVVLLTGSAPWGDLDLFVVNADGVSWDPNGYDDPDAALYVSTVLRGSGPTMLVAPKAEAEGVEIEIVRDHSRERPPQGPEFAHLVVVRDWGRPTERATLRIVPLTEEPIRIPLDEP